MTQKTIHAKKLNGHGERERFERWLLDDGTGDNRYRLINGSLGQQRMICVNLRFAHEAHFATDAKVAVLGDLCRSVDPKKAFLALKALNRMARGELMSEKAREVFKDLAQDWCTHRNKEYIAAKFGQGRYAQGRQLVIEAASYQSSFIRCSINEYLGLPG